jgi:outer membrane protein assembly factor BamA
MGRNKKFRPQPVVRVNLIFLAACLLLTACSTTKNLPEGEKLYTGASVKLSGEEDLTARERKLLRAELQGMARPKPNSRFLGIPFKLGFYNLFYKAKPNSFFGKLRNKFGEPPVLLSDVNLDNNTKILRSHLENKGFFKAKVTSDTVVKARKASAVYEAISGWQSHINTVTFIPDSTELANAIRESAAGSLLKVGEPYDLDIIKLERTRIDAYLKERGFFYFSPEALLVQADTTNGNNTVNMRVIIKPETPDNARQPYYINNVYIYSGYRLNGTGQDTAKSNAQFHEGYYVIDPRRRFKPKMFEQALQFDAGELYNRTDHNLTLSRLINLNEFKAVRNRFERVPDSAKLDAYYYLTPHPRQSLRGEIRTTSKSNNQQGSQISATWLNRNFFRAGEQLSISAYAGSEVQFSGNWKGYNIYRSGAELNLAIPRFFIPFTDIKTKGGYIPRTNVQLGYDILNRRKLYTLNSYRFGFGFLWKESLKKNHEFYPISVNYVQPINVTAEYRDSVFKYPYLERIVDSQFILGSTYQYNYNDLATGIKKTNSYYFQGLIDLSGNVAGLLMGADARNGKPARIMNALFDQYIKLETDARYYRKIGLNSTWANRVIIGYGLPYGNSSQLPYIKQFFSGGNNSIRAFRSRSLLGSYTFPDTSGSGFLPDQTGDMMMEFNTEFRPKISGPLYGALFIDAGNTWLKNPDPDRPGAEFTKDFMKQLAVGAGVGIRLDIQLFVIRLDVAFPLRKPWQDNPWVIRNIDPSSKAWRRENVVYNLAIGYPF